MENPYRYIIFAITKNINKMRRKIEYFIISIALVTATSIIVSCVHNPQGDTTKTETHQLGDYTVKTIDSCEYLEYEGGLGETAVYSLTHKGNCKNCHESLLKMLQGFFK